MYISSTMEKHISGILIANNYLTKCKLEDTNIELARKLLSFKIKEALAALSQKTVVSKKAKN